MTDIAQVIIIATSVLGSLLLVARGLLQLAKYTKTTKDDKYLGKIVKFLNATLEVISGIKYQK